MTTSAEHAHYSPFTKILVAAAIIATATACGMGQRSDLSQGLSNPNADTVWQHVKKSHFQQEWPFWPGKSAFYQGTQPHGAVLMTYVNPVAHEAMMKGSVDQLPIGSIIVKENYSPDRVLQATTVMYKAAEGYNPDHNDWFWLKRTADGTVAASGKVDGCQACHQQSSTDYLMTPLP